MWRKNKSQQAGEKNDQGDGQDLYNQGLVKTMLMSNDTFMTNYNGIDFFLLAFNHKSSIIFFIS